MQERPRHVADDVHDLRLAGPLAALVDDGERRVDALGERPGAHDAADVGRDDHLVAVGEPLLDVAHHDGGAEEVVGRDVEEALDLAGVEIERQHAVDARMGDEIGHQFGRDRRARGGFPILPGIAEIGDHRGDAAGRGAAQGVADDQQFHQVIVGRKRGRLDDEHILAAHIFLDLDEDFHVGEAPHLTFGERDIEIGGDGLRQRTVRISRNELHETIFGLIIDQENAPRDVIVPSAARRSGLSSDRKPSQYALGRRRTAFPRVFPPVTRTPQARRPPRIQRYGSAARTWTH